MDPNQKASVNDFLHIVVTENRNGHRLCAAIKKLWRAKMNANRCLCLLSHQKMLKFMATTKGSNNWSTFLQFMFLLKVEEFSNMKLPGLSSLLEEGAPHRLEGRTHQEFPGRIRPLKPWWQLLHFPCLPKCIPGGTCLGKQGKLGLWGARLQVAVPCCTLCSTCTDLKAFLAAGQSTGCKCK